MPRARGSKNPNAGSFKKGESGNPAGRPPAGTSFAERCRVVAGDGRKLAWLYGCLSGILPLELVEKEFGSSGLNFATRIRQFMQGATIRDRLYCAGRIEDRAFGLIKQEHEHSGTVSLPVRVVHEYQTLAASS